MERENIAGCPTDSACAILTTPRADVGCAGASATFSHCDDSPRGPRRRLVSSNESWRGERAVRAVRTALRAGGLETRQIARPLKLPKR